MAKITVHLGLTLPGPQEYSSIRADVDLAEIDVDGDVEQQLAKCLEVVEKVADKAEVALAQRVSNASNLNVEGVGLAAEFADFRSKLRVSWDKLVERLKAVEGKDDGAKSKRRSTSAD